MAQKPDIDMKFLRVGWKTILGLPVAAMCIAMVFLMLRHRTKNDEKLIRKFLRRMESYGYTKKRAEGLEEFVSRIEPEDVRFRATQFVQEFQKLFYRDQAFGKEDILRMEGHLREI
jgi:hypothetical protein